MSNNYSESNYVRAVNVAGAIVASAITVQEDADELTPKDVAKNVLDLAAELAKGQDKHFKKNEFKGKAYSTTPSQSSKKSSGGDGSSGGGLTSKQKATLQKAYNTFDERGEEPPYTLEDIESASGKERSEMIGKVFSGAWD